MVGLKTLQQGRQFQALVLAIISVSITKPQELPGMQTINRTLVKEKVPI